MLQATQEARGENMSGKFIGLFVGLILGIVWMWLGFGAAVLVGFLGLIGWCIGWFVSRVARGSVNVADLWRELQGRP